MFALSPGEARLIHDHDFYVGRWWGHMKRGDYLPTVDQPLKPLAEVPDAIDTTLRLGSDGVRALLQKKEDRRPIKSLDEESRIEEGINGIIHDTGKTAKNLVTGHPIRAIGSAGATALRVPDIVVGGLTDGSDSAFGIRDNNYHTAA